MSRTATPHEQREQHQQHEQRKRGTTDMTYQQPEPLAFTAGRLTGRVIFVTGASSGIGAAAVRRFAAEGALVAAAARRADRVEALAAELRAAGHEALGLECDVTDERSVADAVAETVRVFGRLDGAFNNAGAGGARARLHELDTDHFDTVMATNVRGVFLSMKHQIPAMLDSGGGSVVISSSVAGLVGSPLNTDYSTSKHALTGLVKCAALDYARDNIRVNAIAPGPTRSEMFDRWMPTDEARAALADRFPMNYVADPDDMARAALFLLSDESRWTTGTVLPCEGGLTAG
ncbi:SDR family NAD(P)-dependent oxidoreductase [Streptomyces syringium]|uniref:SDR family NAD(P)-dependent oxidoreductase n=1 Tax=Streptomyces syringium TaxID=76729 RepID=UPI0036565274